MKYILDTIVQQQSVICLQQLVKKLVNSFKPLATSHNSFMVNNVMPGIEVIIDESLLSFVVGNLMKAVINNTHDDCIHIDSLVSGSFVMLQIKDSSGYHCSTLANDMRHLQQVAGMIGAYISVNNGDSKGITVSLTLMRRTK